MSEWPEVNGKPAAKIQVHAEEKVGLPNYSNVTIGASVTKFVEDGDPEEIRLQLEELARGTVEDFVAAERQELLSMMTEGKK